MVDNFRHLGRIRTFWTARNSAQRSNLEIFLWTIVRCSLLRTLRRNNRNPGRLCSKQKPQKQERRLCKFGGIFALSYAFSFCRCSLLNFWKSTFDWRNLPYIDSCWNGKIHSFCKQKFAQFNAATFRRNRGSRNNSEYSLGKANVWNHNSNSKKLDSFGIFASVYDLSARTDALYAFVRPVQDYDNGNGLF